MTSAQPCPRLVSGSRDSRSLASGRATIGCGCRSIRRVHPSRGPHDGVLEPQGRKAPAWPLAALLVFLHVHSLLAPPTTAWVSWLWRRACVYACSRRSSLRRRLRSHCCPSTNVCFTSPRSCRRAWVPRCRVRCARRWCWASRPLTLFWPLRSSVNGSSLASFTALSPAGTCLQGIALTSLRSTRL